MTPRIFYNSTFQEWVAEGRNGFVLFKGQSSKGGEDPIQKQEVTHNVK